MTSHNFSQGRYLEPEGDSSDSDGLKVPDTSQNSRPRKRVATVYDAVAGRVSISAPLTAMKQPDAASQPQSVVQDGYRLANPTLAPEEVLFRRKNAPERYAEKDMYFANEDLPDEGRGVLPDSDLLKAIHAYSSQFYEAMGRRNPSGCFVGSRLVDERSMDETALLAFGILLEEAAREVVKKGGDLVFTEGMVDAEDDHEALKDEAGTKEDYVGFKQGDGFWRRSYPKPRRRKLHQPAVDSEDESQSLSAD